jgi:hypothetical protein
MGKAKEHLRKLSKLSEKIMALGESLRQAEKDMESIWADEVEKRDLENVKERMKAVEDTLCLLQLEVGHIEAEHCKGGKK